MLRGRRLVKNTLVMTAATLLMRSVGLAFQSHLTGRIGAEGIGLYALVMSVSGFAATLAISGGRFSALRLVAEELGAGRKEGARRAMERCMTYAGLCGLAAGTALYLLSGFVAGRLVGDIRAALSLRLLAASLPFLSVGAVLSGFFTVAGKVGQASLVHLAEQGMRILATLWALNLVPQGDLELACASVTAGGAAGEVQSCLLLYLLYRRCVRAWRDGSEVKGLWRRLVSVACPLAFTAYLRTALSTIENLWIPRGLRRYGASPEKALADYGVVQGMVLPVVTYPAALFVSAAEVTVPALTAMQAGGKEPGIQRTVNRLIRGCVLFSVGCAALLWHFAEGLGMGLYQSQQAVDYIRALAALMPLMYLDTCTDGILRGLGEHMWCMYVNLADACLRVAAVLFLLPRYGLGGYLFLLYASEMLNFALSMGRLCRITRVQPPIAQLLLGALGAAGAVAADSFLFQPVSEGFLLLRMVLCCGIYGLILLLVGQISLPGKQKRDGRKA